MSELIGLYQPEDDDTRFDPVQPEDNDDDDDTWYELDEDYYDCAMLPDGTCMAAGSEDCDFECPFGPMRNPKLWGTG